jgi:hypothetical protein
MSLISASVSLFDMLRLRTCSALHYAQRQRCCRHVPHLALNSQVLGGLRDVTKAVEELAFVLRLRRRRCAPGRMASRCIFRQHAFQHRHQKFDLPCGLEVGRRSRRTLGAGCTCCDDDALRGTCSGSCQTVHQRAARDVLAAPADRAAALALPPSPAAGCCLRRRLQRLQLRHRPNSESALAATWTAL